VISSLRKSKRPPRGFLILDTVAGIVLALFLLMVMTVAVVKQERRQRELSEMRAAARAAEAALLALQSGAPLPAGAKLTPLPSDPIPSRQWVQITATTGTHTSTLVGLINAPTAGGAQ
jgi:type II secretory pathway pseudopilin PulG